MWHVPGSTSHTQIQSISEKDSPSSAPPKNSSLEKQRRWHNIVVDAYLLQMELRSGTHGTMITPFKKGAGGRYWNPEMARLGVVSYWVYHKQLHQNHPICQFWAMASSSSPGLGNPPMSWDISRGPPPGLGGRTSLVIWSSAAGHVIFKKT